MKSHQAIGFASQFYTLWTISVDDTYVVDSHGRSRVSGQRVTYTYHKNISKDVEKVKAIYPNLSIVEDLRGKTRSWSEESKVDLCPEIMKLGKYAGYDLNELVQLDFNYVLWIIENYSYSSNGQYAAQIDKVKNYLQEKEDAENAAISKKENAFEKFVESGTYELVAQSNLKICDYKAYLPVKIDDDLTVFLMFSDFKQQYYGGCTYGLPIIKGAAKKIKGKTLTVSFEKRPDIVEWWYEVWVTDIKMS